MTSQDLFSDLPAESPAYYEMEPPMMISRIDTVATLGPDTYGPYDVVEYADPSSSSSSSASNSISNLDPRTPSFTNSCATTILEDNPPVPSKESNSKRSGSISHIAYKKLSPVKVGVRTMRKSCSSHVLETRGKMKNSVAESKWNATGWVDQKIYSTQDGVSDLSNNMRQYVSAKMDAFTTGLDDKILSLDERFFAPKQASSECARRALSWRLRLIP